jgi:hypothetical protein
MDLNTASIEQLDAYRATVAKTMNIDPLMLDYIWMNDPETGLRNRVLYAKRGAAEVLRHELNISVTGLTLAESNGWVMFTATGKIPAGRQEMAVGAAFLEGRKGDKLAHAVMTAQTRAIRRLTLQFVTGGILDESEVQAQSDLAGPSAASSAALAGSPLVVPPPLAPTAINAAPGKDITPQLTPNTPDAAVTPPQTPEEFSAAQQALRDEAKAQLDANPPAKAKRTRKSRNTVSIASPGQEPVKVSQPDSPVLGNGMISQVSTPAIEVPVSAPPVAAVEKAQPVVAQLPAPPPTAALDPEKAKEFRERLRVYYNDVLPKGGMLPVENVGGPTMQMRKFATTHTGAGDMNSLSLSQWEDLFDFLDNYTKTNGAQALVQYISKAIGATK